MRCAGTSSSASSSRQRPRSAALFGSSRSCAVAPPRRCCQRIRGTSRSSSMSVSAVLSGKTCVVTGASQGIGLEFCRQLLAKQNTVVAAVRSPATATELAALQAQFPAAGGSGSSSSAARLHITTLDVASPDSIQAWAAGLQAACPGLRHCDVVINNAGIYGPRLDVRTVTAADMQACFATNTVGPLLVVQALLKQGLIGGMGGKSVVGNVTSKVGSVDDNKSGGGYAYRASKSALNIINKSLSIDLAGEGITSVLLHPGYVRTRMTSGQGLIDASESVAGLISVLEGSAGPLNGCWYDFAGKVIPW